MVIEYLFQRDVQFMRHDLGEGGAQALTDLAVGGQNLHCAILIFVQPCHGLDSRVMAIMGHYNAAQITDFLNTSIESKAANLTAALLNYKQEHFPEYDAFSEFTLE